MAADSNRNDIRIWLMTNLISAKPEVLAANEAGILATCQYSWLYFVLLANVIIFLKMITANANGVFICSRHCLQW